MDDQLHKNHPSVRRLYLYIFLLTAFLFLFFVIYYLNQGAFQLPNLSGQPQVTPEPTAILQMEEKGTFDLAVRNNDLNQVQSGQTFFLTVVADSQESPIVGFDALLTYDRDAFTMGTATTPLQSFQLFSEERDDHQSFTAALAPNASASAFMDTEILSIPFTPTQTGKYTFQIVSSSGDETTKMVEESTTKVFAPAVSALQVTVY